MDVHPTEKKPTWWLLYTLGATLVGSIGLIETSVPGGAARLLLELAAVVTISVLMLGWLRLNRGRIELAEARPTRGTGMELDVAASSPPRRKSPVKIAASGRPGHTDAAQSGRVAAVHSAA